MIASAGLLVAKTLTNATANPFLSGGAGSYNPVLALDVFQVQVGSIISHMHVFRCRAWCPHVLQKHLLKTIASHNSAIL